MAKGAECCRAVTQIVEGERDRWGGSECGERVSEQSAREERK